MVAVARQGHESRFESLLQETFTSQAFGFKTEIGPVRALNLLAGTRLRGSTKSEGLPGPGTISIWSERGGCGGIALAE